MKIKHQTNGPPKVTIFFKFISNVDVEKNLLLTYKFEYISKHILFLSASCKC